MDREVEISCFDMAAMIFPSNQLIVLVLLLIFSPKKICYIFIDGEKVVVWIFGKGGIGQELNGILVGIRPLKTHISSFFLDFVINRVKIVVLGRRTYGARFG